MTAFDSHEHPRADDGQFSSKEHTGPEVALQPHVRVEPPLAKLRTTPLNSPASFFIERREDVDLDPPYQRGSVWTVEQRQDLIKSMLIGLPIGSVTVNDRGVHKDPMYSVVDGKQRVEAIRAFADDELAIPRDWLPDDSVLDTTNGPSVVFSELSRPAQRKLEATTVVQLRTEVGSVEAEARLFLLLNGGGTPQTDTTMADAAKVAGR